MNISPNAQQAEPADVPTWLDAAWLDAMVRGYVECALWSSYDSYDDGGKPLDAEHGPDDLDPAALAQFRTDCEAFATTCAADLIDDDGRPMDAGQAGHDFWLTRNGHGTGFWDRGLGERGERLSAMARPYREVDLYLGDDGRIHAQ